jgi:ATP-dependent Clp protease ATP-binding subunit ClpA
VIKFVDELKVSLTGKNIRLNMSEAVVDMLAEKGYDSKMGARPLSRKIDELIRVPLSKKILFDKLGDCTVVADLVDDQVEFKVEHQIKPQVNSEGYIVVEIPNDIHPGS